MHFAYLSKYRLAKEGKDLFQGDLIFLNAALRKTLKARAVKLPSELLGYLVLSQTCDLVSSRVKADPICAAPVYALDELLPGFISEVAPPVLHSIRKAKDRKKVDEFLARLYNQNEYSMGLFYVHPEPSIGLGIPAVATLRKPVSFPVADYEVLKKGRVTRLTAEFRGKLGWMVGNLYARQATTDFDPAELTKLKRAVTAKMSFISPLVLQRLKALPGHAALSEGDVQKFVTNEQRAQSKSEVLRAVMSVASATLDLSDKQSNKLKNALWKDIEVETSIKDAEARGRATAED